ncbi:MAG: polysaccharide biosynthesis tyrosine autokinase [Gemmatimonadota bacterium]|nr:polysaccharide biosynthesis tyrosine autokinase [Gemmatimonadota bacterium]
MQANEIRLQDYLSVLYRKKWAIVLSFFLVLSVSIYSVLSKPPVFTSSAVVQIETRTLNPEGEVVQDITQSVQYYARIFRTGIFQKEVIDSLTADVQSWVIIERDRVNLTELVRDNLVLEPDNVQRFFRIRASAHNPMLAFRMAGISSGLFERRLQEIESQTIQDSDEYLDDQITVLQAEVEEIEIRIRQFLKENALITISGEVSGNQDFTGLQQQLSEVQLREDLTRAKLRSYRRKREELLSRDTISPDTDIAEILREIRAIASQNDSLGALRTSLLARYDETHPEIVALSAQIENNNRRGVEIEAQQTRSTITEDKDEDSLLPMLQENIRAAASELFEMNTDAEYYEYRIRQFADENPNLFDEGLDKELEYARLQRSKELYETTYNLLIQRREEQRFRLAMQTGNIKVIDPADLPADPISTNAPRQILFGALIGLSLGLGAAFLLEYMDSSLKSSEDVTRFLDLPLVGEIPKIKSPIPEGNGFFGMFKGNKNDKDASYETKLIDSFSPKEPIPEAYRNIRTSLQFSSADEQLNCFVITSPNPSEGKSLTSANLAIGYAQSGKRVLLIDTDLRRPVMHKIFNVVREPGITEVLTGQMDSAEAIRPIPLRDSKEMYLLTAGQSTPNPGELIGSQKMDEVLEQLNGQMDIVMLDSPPVIAAVDSAILGSKSQGVLLIFHMDQTKRESAKYCIEQLHRAGSRVIGGVLNNIDVDRRYGYYYSYRYYYRYKYYYDSEESKESKPSSG